MAKPLLLHRTRINRRMLPKIPLPRNPIRTMRPRTNHHMLIRTR